MTSALLIRDAARDAALWTRLLRRRPAFAVIALLTLALGIGAPTAIFSVVNAVLIRPLPYVDADRIARFRVEAQTPAGPFAFDALPVDAALEWAAGARTLQALAVFNDTALTLSTAEGPFRLTGISASQGLFDLLGAAPAFGRTFGGRDTDLHQVVLSDAMWRRFFKADPAIAGSNITLDGDAYRVTGVMLPGFQFPTPDAMFWVPQMIASGQGRGMALPAIARLRPGATLSGAEAEGLLFLGHPGPRIQQRLIARSLQDQMVGGIRRVLWVLMAAVSLVSVIAAVNIALLLLTRGAAREREFSIRMALGAGRARVARQLFVEGVLLAVLGGAAGIVFAGVGLRLLMQLAPADLPRLHEVALDGRVLVFASLVTLAASLIFGVLSAGRFLTHGGLRRLTGPVPESRLVSTGPARHRLNALAGSELALTMVLLVGAGLLLRSFASLVMTPQGFDSRGALAFSVNLPLARYPTADARLAWLDRLHAQLAAMPGVSAVGFAAEMPNRQPTGRFQFSAAPVDPTQDPMTRATVETRMIGAGFLEAMGLALRAGRTFAASDGRGGEAVIVVSDSFARQQFGTRNPVGQMLYSESGDRRVIGVVSDVRPAVEGAEIVPAAYLPLSQQSDILSWHATMNVVLRASDDALAQHVRSVVLALDPQLPPANVRPLSADIANVIAGPRFSAAVLALFGGAALLMASLGIYGVLAYAASQRTREIGVRIALGASPAQVLRLMMRDGLAIVAGGIAVGAVTAAWFARALTGLLHDVTPADPLSLALVAVVLAGTGLCAAYIPARRATRLNPVLALRSE